MEYFDSFFGAVNCFDSSGKYDLASCPGAQAEANFLASYDSYLGRRLGHGDRVRRGSGRR